MIEAILGYSFVLCILYAVSAKNTILTLVFAGVGLGLIIVVNVIDRSESWHEKRHQLIHNVKQRKHLNF